MVLPTGGRKPGIPGQSRNELTDRILVINDFKSAIESVDDGKELRVSGGTVRGRDPDATCPLDYMDDPDEADGTTDNYAAIMTAYDRLPDRGGAIDFAGRHYFSSESIEIEKPIRLLGGASGWDISNIGTGGMITFPAGVSGIKLLADAKMSSITSLNLNSQSTEAGSDHGLTVQCTMFRLDNMYVRNFGGHGVLINGDEAEGLGNSNVGLVTNVRSRLNRGDGFHISGDDAQACTFVGISATENDGYGVYNSGNQNVFMHPVEHLNGTGAFYDDTLSSVWILPYSEHNDKFVITGASQKGVLIMPGPYGKPKIWSGSEPVEGSDWAATRGWLIWDDDSWARQIQVQSTASGSGGDKWQMVANGDRLYFRNVTDAKTVLDIWSTSTNPRLLLQDGTNIEVGTSTGTKIGTSSSQKLGFFNATPVAKPAVTGATDSEKIDNLLTALANLGLITDSTT